MLNSGIGGTLKVTSTQGLDAGLDPQTAYSFPELEILRCCLARSLMGFQGISGFAGTQPVPDLASGYPTVSSDGRTWTFHIRHGIHYAPPLQDVEVTAPDFVRAIMRTASGTPNPAGGHDGLSAGYLTLIVGYQAYLSGASDAIAGLSTPDPYTLQVRETRPDRSLLFLLAEPWASPVPPSPSDPGAPLGIATGHDTGPMDSYLASKQSVAGNIAAGQEGYGPFQAATGPYMIEGADAIDYSLPAAQQQSPSGITGPWWSGSAGALTLVRNPSWSPATDPTRLALPDRIEITISQKDPYPGLLSGASDTVMGTNPPTQVVHSYGVKGLQHRIAQTPTDWTVFLSFNLAEPPFDDIHVRRALAILLNRPVTARRVTTTPPSQKQVTSHYLPDPMDNSLLADWVAVDGTASSQDLSAARTQMRLSTYGNARGRCVGPSCRSLSIMWPNRDGLPMATLEHQAQPVLHALALLGMTGHLAPSPPSYGCFEPTQHTPLCVFGFSPDYPDAGAMFVPFLAPGSSGVGSMLGLSPRQLKHLGYPPIHVPSIDADYRRCAATVGPEAAPCWARLDQELVSQDVALIPLFVPDAIRLEGRDVTSFSIDQAFAEPSLDRIGVSTATPSP